MAPLFAFSLHEGACHAPPTRTPSGMVDVGLYPHCHSCLGGCQTLSELEIITSRNNNYSITLLRILEIEAMLPAFKQGDGLYLCNVWKQHQRTISKSNVCSIAIFRVSSPAVARKLLLMTPSSTLLPEANDQPLSSLLFSL